MSDAPSSKAYLAKAEAALSGARLLLSSHDMDGACSRAYYAMFDAAHAALFALGVEQIAAPIKTHIGLVAQFGQRVVLAGHMSADHGEALNRVQRFRQLADYSGDPISPENAKLAVEQAEAFVAATGVRHEFITTHELENPLYVANNADRCYHCKSELMDRLAPIAAAEGAVIGPVGHVLGP